MSERRAQKETKETKNASRILSSGGHIAGLLLFDPFPICCKETDLSGLTKGDKSKVALARRLRHETTKGPKCIRRRMRMGNWSHVRTCQVKNNNADLVSMVGPDTCKVIVTSLQKNDTIILLRVGTD
jgi:hypothetical protein